MDWNVETVLDYFGEELGSEEGARAMMELAEARVRGGTFFQHMNEVRSILLSAGHSVPFRSVYRRVKL